MQPEEREHGLKPTLLRAGIVLGAFLGGLVGLLSVLNALRRGRVTADRGRESWDGGREAGDETRYAPRAAQYFEQTQPEPAKLEPGWSVPRPAELPRPTYWPAVMALGIVLLIWGLVSSLVISGVGLALFAVGLTGWIGEMSHAQ